MMIDYAILSLDIATKTGWAIRHPNGKILCGLQKFPHKKSHRSEAVRYVEFRNWLNQMVLFGGVGLVTYEQVSRMPSMKADHLWAHLACAMKLVCEDRDVAHMGFAVSSIKKNYTGNAKASKQQMIDEAVRRGFKPETDDVADALAILDLTIKELDLV